MNTLRTYLDIITESNLFENPWEGKDPAKAAAWSALSPQDQQWLGGADPTDTIILNRAPNKGKPVATAIPVAEPAQTAATAAAPVPTTGGDTGEVPGVTTQPQGQAAMPAEPKNRDSMTFGQAFADARKGGEKTFTWKGKPYTTDVAKPNTQAPSGITAATPAASGSTLTPQQNAQLQSLMSQRVAAYQRGDTTAVAGFDAAIKQWATGVEQSKTTSESVGYAEDQNLVSIVQLAGLK